jgi:hypothetical protein
VCEIDLDVLELIENILAKNAVDLSVHCVGDALHILYENAMVFPNSRSGDQCRFSPAPVSYESGALFRRISVPKVDRIEPGRFRTQNCGTGACVQDEGSQSSINPDANQEPVPCQNSVRL